MKKLFSFSALELLSSICVIILITGLVNPFIDKTSKKDKIVITLKEVYEKIEDAISRYNSYDDRVELWDWNNPNVIEASGKILEKRILPLFQEYKSCKAFPLYCVGGYSSLNNEEYVNYRRENQFVRALINKDKTHIALTTTGACVPKKKDSVCGILVVDVDNKEGENKLGYDVFVFAFYGDGSFLPYGYNEKYEKIQNECRDKDSFGDTCAAKIMHDGWVMKNVGKNQYPI